MAWEVQAHCLSQIIAQGPIVDLDGTNIICQDLRLLASYWDWHHRVSSSLNYYCESGLIPAYAFNYLTSDLSRAHHYFVLSGVGDLLVHIWPNGEPKLFPLWSRRYLLDFNLFWLQYYPFFSIPDANPRHSVISVDSSIVARHFVGSQYEPASLIASTNNHFGHFIADSLPYLNLLTPISLKRPNGLAFPYSFRPAIAELVALSDPRLSSKCLNSWVSELPPSATSLVKNISMLQVQPSSILTAGYLYRTLYSRLSAVASYSYRPSSDLPCTTKNIKIALTREGSYASRIHNYVDFRRHYESQGFIFIDSSNTTLPKLLQLLGASSIILCESGSTTLNAAIFAPPSSRIISLNPRRLFSSPDHAMLNGGLPYLIAFCDRIEFFLGESIMPQETQSSDTAYYSLSELDRFISEPSSIPFG